MEVLAFQNCHAGEDLILTAQNQLLEALQEGVDIVLILRSQTLQAHRVESKQALQAGNRSLQAHRISLRGLKSLAQQCGLGPAQRATPSRRAISWIGERGWPRSWKTTSTLSSSRGPPMRSRKAA